MLTRRGDVSYCGSCLEIHYHLGRISRHFAWEENRQFLVRVTKSSIRLVTCTLLTQKDLKIGQGEHMAMSVSAGVR